MSRRRERRRQLKMPVFETYTKRKQAAELAGKPVIYTYDTLPQRFRVQVVYIIKDVCNAASGWVANKARKALVRDMGQFTLADLEDPFEDCREFTLNSTDVDNVFSLIELIFFYASHPQAFISYPQTIKRAADELNQRFREHQLGYQYHSGQIVPVNSEYLYAEAVEPSLSLLAEPGFEGPCEEFLKAHKHYREGNHREAISQAENAFESTMKVICDERGLKYEKNITAKGLIAKLINEGSIPPELQSEIQSLRNLLAAGVPAIRNSKAGHGQGAKVVDVPDYLASYALHLTASNIVFLVEAHRANR